MISYPSGDFKCSFHNGFISSKKLSQDTKLQQFDVQQHKPSKQRGSDGLRGEPKRKIRSMLQILQQVYTKQCLSFLTCTIPVTGKKLTKIINDQWGEIKRKFYQELTRLLETKKLPTDYVAVDEIQPKRLYEDGELAPHLHIVFVGRHLGKHWAITPNEIRSIWNRIVSNHLPKRLKFDGSASTRIEQIKYSVRNYLTKYLTKGSTVDKVKELGLADQLPRQWWSATNNLKAAAKAAIETLDEGLSDYIERNLERFKQAGYVRWYFRIEKELEDFSTNAVHKVCFGIVGCFSDGGLEKIRALFHRECPVTNLTYHPTQKPVEASS